jgi:hypothetical protein
VVALLLCHGSDLRAFALTTLALMMAGLVGWLRSEILIPRSALVVCPLVGLLVGWLVGWLVVG